MLPAWAANYIGIPYLSGGRDRAGVDCYGLVCLVLREQGLEPPDYPLNAAQASLPGRVKAFVRAIQQPAWAKVCEPAEGDVIVLTPNRLPTHCGILLDSENMLHVEDDISSCVESIKGVIWANRVQGFYRLKQ